MGFPPRCGVWLHGLLRAGATVTTLPHPSGSKTGSQPKSVCVSNAAASATWAGPKGRTAGPQPPPIGPWAAERLVPSAWRSQEPGESGSRGWGRELWRHQEATFHKLVGWAASGHDSAGRPPVEDDGRVARAGAVGEDALGVRALVVVRGQ